jgi:hypothetical protein
MILEADDHVAPRHRDRRRSEGDTRQQHETRRRHADDPGDAGHDAGGFAMCAELAGQQERRDGNDRPCH